ncbi:response regulator containing a CheY-like receiver domain and an HTH DNA-binding domain [Mycolicibacterium aurum]|uniref:Response regulator containing a CheY-like receiver domain and an HTH DNA-binding domain n=2 Tax=Mycolicibacterium aurum TaxID=1791 RepID=A0A448J184_MYCAU|nr:LuxR family transcriptional regulator [Mycolicibacterium aurum]VEG58429.1 response regulator containing a CheY-like receiver domain and an HTH DNA-binding domain [Mycolicibacterium aurum]
MDEFTSLISGGAFLGMVLTGKPGVGKSRLAREAARAAADAGWTVRRAAATATSRSIPLGAFAQWTDDVDGAPLALAHNVIAALSAGAQPGRLLVFVDDAHLLDELSALVLHQLVQAERASAIVTIRTGERTPDAVIALWKDGLLQRREVQPLSHNETDTLLTAVLGCAPDRHCSDRMWQLTRGNILFLRQLVDQESRAERIVTADGAARWLGNLAVSASLAEVVDSQIGAIPDTVRDVLDLVSLAEPLDWRILRTLANPIAIEEAEQRELIRTSDDVVYVGHPLYGEVRLNRCGPSRLRRLRGQVAKAMKDSGGPANAVRRGLLWLESDLPPETDVLLSAATAASSLLDFETAERLLTAAADAGGGTNARVQLAYSLFMLHKGQFASEVIDSIDAGEDSRSAYINDVIVRAANLLWPLQSPEESRRVIDEALETASGAHRHQLLVFRANQLTLAGRPADVIDVMARIDYSELDAFGTTIGLCAETLAFGELGQPDAAVAKAIECRRGVDLSDQGRFLRQPLVEFHTFALAAAGLIGDAVEVAEEYRLDQRDGPASARAVASEIVGMAALAAGDLGAALRHLPTQLVSDEADVAGTNSFWVASSFHRFYLLRAQALARSGDVDAASDALETARAHRKPSSVYVLPAELLTEAWVAAARQRLVDARRLARSAAEKAREGSQWAREVWSLQTSAQFDDTEVAARLAELAAFVRGPRAAVAARYAAALSADDAGGLAQASVEFEAMGDLLAAADAAGQAAASHRRAGRVGSAMTAASRVRGLATACGGASSPAIAAAAFAPPFTRREREIAVLVAQGLSNREIAQAVSLSVRTVESHIYNASNKAGVTGRSALADVIRRATG